MKMRVLTTIVAIACVGLPVNLSAAAQQSDFFAYYTRVGSAPAHVDKLAGDHADVVLNFNEKRQLIFSRSTSYLPYWQTENGEWPLEEIVPRRGDGPAERPDDINRYSHVRLIEDTPSKAVVHWRYIADFSNLEWDGFVDEYFTVTSDGTVKRTVRQGRKNIEDWQDSSNLTTQVLKLEPNGIRETSRTDANPQALPRPAVEGNPVTSSPIEIRPSAHWRFDDGLEQSFDKTVEEISGVQCAIDGHKSLWKKGVSGTALAFDGYYSQVTLPADKAPDLSGNFTIEAWIALGAYPWNEAPIVHQSTGMGRTGYYFGVDPYGHLFFRANGETVRSPVTLDINRWTHVVVTVAEGVAALFIDGKKFGTGRVPLLGDINQDVVIGLNTTPKEASDAVSITSDRPLQANQPRIFGIEGLIDEVKFYATALKREQLTGVFGIEGLVDEVKFDATAFKREQPTGIDAELKPSSTEPDLEPRVLPGEPGTAQTFGAYYTNLHFHDLWDNLWRTSDHPDIVVKFDDKPTSVVFWRGTNYGFGMVTDANHWMVDQSAEEYEEYGCMEHMSDKQNRMSYVRLVENTDARVVVHWRYAAVDILYQFPKRASGWVDEYFFIYPDGVTMRKVIYRDTSWPGWQTLQFLTQPNQRDEDVVHLQALTVADLDGNVLELDWTNGPPKEAVRNSTLKNHSVQVMNFQSDYNVFFIGEQDTKLSWLGGSEVSPYLPVHFAGPWNHWPVAQIPSDGRFSVALDRVTSYAFAASEYDMTRGYVLYGFTDQSASELVPLARSWVKPPSMSEVAGGVSRGYDKSQRAYQLVAEADTLSFTLDGSEDSPVVNPCIVVKNWGSSDRAELKIDGKNMRPGKNIRQGVVRDTDGKQTLVVWVEIEAAEPVAVSIARVDR